MAELVEGLTRTSPETELYRLGRVPAVWVFPPWEYADRAHGQSRAHTFGNRFDDAEGRFRVIYCSSVRLGAFIECLARFRPDPQVVAGTAAIEDDTGEDSGDDPPWRLHMREWLADRLISTARMAGSFLDLGSHDSLAILNRHLIHLHARYGFRELDLNVVHSEDRDLTQDLSTSIYGLTDRNGRSLFHGIRYPSRLGDDVSNWGIYERTDITVTELQVEISPDMPVAADDPDLAQAVEKLGLEVEW